jgi:hypothetical protein
VRGGGDTASRLQCSRSRNLRHRRLDCEGMAGWRWWEEARVDKISPDPIDPPHIKSKIPRRSHGPAKIPLYTWDLFRTLTPLLSLTIMAVDEIAF